MNDLVHVKGLADLQRFLDQVPAKLERNVLRGALRAGANVLKPAAQANIHSVSGDLAHSLKVRSDARGGRVTASVYTRHFTARWVEYGTKPHDIAPKNRQALSIGGLFFASVHHPGAKGVGFLRNALDTRAADAVVAAARYMQQRLATQQGLDTTDIVVEAL